MSSFPTRSGTRRDAAGSYSFPGEADLRMKKELDHYYIGDSYGGSQDWFTDLWMNRGGCGAVTAAECCISLALNHGLTQLYPFDASHVT